MKNKLLVSGDNAAIHRHHLLWSTTQAPRCSCPHEDRLGDIGYPTFMDFGNASLLKANEHTQLQPTSTPDLPSITTSYAADRVPQPDSTPYSAYPNSAGHFVVTSTASDSEQRMVSELITSISDSSPPQQQQLYSPPQQPHSASSVHSNRSPSALYPSQPNSETIQHSSENPHQNGMPTVLYPHASPPSLTPSPEGRDETAPHNITTIEGLVQQHDYPVLYGGADSYNYGASIRFAQDYSTETTV